MSAAGGGIIMGLVVGFTKGSIWLSSAEVRREVGAAFGKLAETVFLFGTAKTAFCFGNSVIIVESAVTGGGGCAGGRQLAKISATTSTGGAGISNGVKEFWRAKIWGLSGETTTKGAGGGSSHSERSSESLPTSQQS